MQHTPHPPHDDPPPPRAGGTRRLRMILGLVALLVALAVIAGIILAGNRDGGTAGEEGRDGGSGGRAAQSSDVWEEGTSWTVRVEKDANVASPGEESQPYLARYDFEVIEAPEEPDGPWVVRAALEDAEGPFRSGWLLYYQERRPDSDEFVLDQVALNVDDARREDAALAPVVLGADFPLQKVISETPTDHTVRASQAGGAPGVPPATPPAGAPPGAPNGDPDVLPPPTDGDTGAPPGAGGTG